MHAQPPAEQHDEGRVTAGPGGLMTDEVGVITGDITVATEIRQGLAHIRVQYTGAEEWYTLTGSPLPATRPPQRTHEAILRAAAAGLPDGITVDHLPR